MRWETLPGQYGKAVTGGYTLLELLIVIALLGILAAMAVPGLMDMLGRTSTHDATRALGNALSLARSEAIKRGAPVSLCPSSDGVDCEAGAWSRGWLVFVDANGDADGAAGSVDAGDTVIQVYQPRAEMALSGGTNLVSYNSRGFALNGNVLTFKACPANQDAVHARAIEVSVSGRPRLITQGLSCP